MRRFSATHDAVLLDTPASVRGKRAAAKASKAVCRNFRSSVGRPTLSEDEDHAKVGCRGALGVAALPARLALVPPNRAGAHTRQAGPESFSVR